MDLRLSRLRAGELLAGAGAVAELVALFALTWFRSGGAAGDHAGRDGFAGLPVLRWLILLTAVLALALVCLQATRRAPALPVVMSVVVSAAGVVTTVVVAVRLLVGSGSPQAGALVGLACLLVIVAGAWASMRQEQGWTPGPDHPVERVSLGPPEHP